jgi:hypothetical protein
MEFCLKHVDILLEVLMINNNLISEIDSNLYMYVIGSGRPIYIDKLTMCASMGFNKEDIIDFGSS